MNKFFHVIGAFAMASIIVLSGCTDAMVGPQSEDDAEHRMVKSTHGTAPPYAELSETLEGTDVQGRIGHRWFEIILPPPDTTQAPGSPGPITPTGRIGQRFGDGLPPDTTYQINGNPTPPPQSRIGSRYMPILPPPDSTNSGNPGGNGS